MIKGPCGSFRRLGVLRGSFSGKCILIVRQFGNLVIISAIFQVIPVALIKFPAKSAVSTSSSSLEEQESDTKVEHPKATKQGTTNHDLTLRDMLELECQTVLCHDEAEKNET